MGVYLPLGAGAAREDGAGVLHFRRAAELLRIHGDDFQQFVEEVPEWDDLALAEIDQPSFEAVALGQPAVLVDEEGRIAAPALIDEER